ncbi:MAG TPA: metal-dependent hydrolase, partial [Pseudomonas sp.]|nr:metal-dependent hydrolase [Pseudomonas sp.]
VQDARRHARPGLWHPAEGLLWPPGERRLRPVPKVQVAGESQAQRWRGLCEQLLHTPSAFATLPQLFDCARQALVACGLPRLLLLTPDRNGQKGNVQLHHGLDDAPGLQLDIASHPLLAKLFGSPGQLRIDAGNRTRFAPHLPADLRRLFSNERLWLRSLGFGERVVLLAILDSELEPADPRRTAALDKTFTCIERAIATFANRSRVRPT